MCNYCKRCLWSLLTALDSVRHCYRLELGSVTGCWDVFSNSSEVWFLLSRPIPLSQSALGCLCVWTADMWEPLRPQAGCHNILLNSGSFLNPHQLVALVLSVWELSKVLCQWFFQHYRLSPGAPRAVLFSDSKDLYHTWLPNTHLPKSLREGFFFFFLYVVHQFSSWWSWWMDTKMYDLMYCKGLAFHFI